VCVLVCVGVRESVYVHVCASAWMCVCMHLSLCEQ